MADIDDLSQRWMHSPASVDLKMDLAITTFPAPHIITWIAIGKDSLTKDAVLVQDSILFIVFRGRFHYPQVNARWPKQLFLEAGRNGSRDWRQT